MINGEGVMSKTIVFCSLQIPGIHRWKTCSLDTVKYLKDFHRHMFWIRCYKSVNHDDRDVEFIDLKNQVYEFLLNEYWDSDTKCCMLKDMSCEMIATQLIEQFNLVQCEVSEDGENGAIVYGDKND